MLFGMLSYLNMTFPCLLEVKSLSCSTRQSGQMRKLDWERTGGLSMVMCEKQNWTETSSSRWGKSSPCKCVCSGVFFRTSLSSSSSCTPRGWPSQIVMGCGSWGPVSRFSCEPKENAQLTFIASTGVVVSRPLLWNCKDAAVLIGEVPATRREAVHSELALEQVGILRPLSPIHSLFITLLEV